MGRNLIGLMLMAAAACSGRTDGAAAAVERGKETAMTNEAGAGEALPRDLPYAHGRSFATLDEYLAHLERYAGPIGQPWYRRVGPGVYERVTTERIPDGRDRPQTFTREQLMREFGFTR